MSQLVSALQQDELLPAELGEQAQSLQERLGEGQLHLAVLGQFKRGKSTLLNALLGEAVLPDGVLPVTAVPTFLYGASQAGLEIHTEDAQEPLQYPISELANFVTEEQNRQNRKEVQRVNLFYPAPLLQEGLVLIDTPGIGSTNENNTETTLRFLPHCDAAIVVFSTDPPITAAEVDFLRELQPHIAHFFFVLNKIDYLSPDEVEKAREFLQDALREALEDDDPRVYALSARHGLAARQSGDDAAWQESGMALFTDHLRAFARQRSQTILQQALRSKAINLLDEAVHLLSLRQEALQLPLAELEQKIAAFHNYADIARRQRQDVDDRLTGDEKRLIASIEAEARKLRRRARSELERQINALDLSLSREKWATRAKAMTADFFDRVREQWHREVRRELEQIIATRSQEVVSLREQLRREAADLLHVSHTPLLEEENIIDLPEVVWVSGTFVPLPQEAPPWEKFLPATWQEQRQKQRGQALVQELVSRNTERVRWWLLQIVRDSVRHFRGQLAEAVEQTIRQVEKALESARHHHQTGTASRQSTLSALENRRQAYLQLRQMLVQPDREREK